MATSDEIVGLGRKTDRPLPNPGADLSRMRLTPVEGFILSRIDGRSSYDEVCKISGLEREQTLAILRKLKQEGLIVGPGEPARAARPAGKPEPSDGAKAGRPGEAVPAPGAKVEARGPAAEAAVVTEDMLRKARQKESAAKPEAQATQSTPLLERLDDGSAVDAAALAEGPDLPDEIKRRIVRLHRRLRKLDAHELLGVAPDAEPAAVKRAFAAASKELHPDRYFGKDLGSYRDKLAQIFARVTEAVQTLQKAGKGKS